MAIAKEESDPAVEVVGPDEIPQPRRAFAADDERNIANRGRPGNGGANRGYHLLEGEWQDEPAG